MWIRVARETKRVSGDQNDLRKSKERGRHREKEDRRWLRQGVNKRVKRSAGKEVRPCCPSDSRCHSHLLVLLPFFSPYQPSSSSTLAHGVSSRIPSPKELSDRTKDNHERGSGFGFPLVLVLGVMARRTAICPSSDGPARQKHSLFKYSLHYFIWNTQDYHTPSFIIYVMF